VKLVRPEPESAALLAAVRRKVGLVMSVLGRVETFRAVLRASRSAALVQRLEETLRLSGPGPTRHRRGVRPAGALSLTCVVRIGNKEAT
jgi:hypothetical protein